MKLRKWLLPVLFTVLIVLIVWLAVSDQSPIRMQGTQSDPVYWESGWQVEMADGSLRLFSMPARLAPSENTIVNTLPENVGNDDYLYIKTNYQQVTAEVGGKAQAVSGIAGDTGGAVTYDLPWSSVALSGDMAGKTIRLTFSDTGSKPFVEVYTVRLGPVSEIRLALLSRSLPTIILSLIIMLFALALVALTTLEKQRRRMPLPHGYECMMAFVLLAGLWFYTDTDVSGISFIGSRAFYFTTLFSYLLMPIPYLLFLGVAQKRLKRLSLVLVGLLGVNALAELLMIVTGSCAVPWAGLVSDQVVLAFACFSMFFLTRGRNRVDRMDGMLAAGIAITSVTGILALALFYLLPLEDNASAFRYGVVVLMIALTMSVLHNNMDLAIQANGMEQLRIREEEYRIAVRQSEKHVVRYDVGLHTILRENCECPIDCDTADPATFPNSAVGAGMVAEESVGDFLAFFKRIDSGEPSGSCTANLRNKNGTFSWYHTDYTMIYSDDGVPLQAVISYADITEQHRRELAYRKWRQRYADMPSEGIVYREYNLTRDIMTDETGEMLPPLPEETRLTLKQAVDHVADHFVLQEDRQRFRAFFRRDRLLEAFSNGIRSDKMEFCRIDEKGDARWTVASVQMINDPYSNDVQGSLLLQDEDEMKRDELRVIDRSNTDPLTGLLNRSAFEEQLGLLLNETDPNVVHALMMIDIDGFKRVNDTFGHQFGDRVIGDIANDLRAMMRNDDLIGRVGGDEFMICLRNIRKNSGFLEKRAGYLCQALNKQFDDGVAISGSIGIALFPQDGRAFGKLYQAADTALYHAKQHGKNRFVFFHGGLLKKKGAAAAKTDDEADESLPAAPGEARRTLLITETSLEMRTLMDNTFRSEYQLLTAAGGKECLTLLKRNASAVSAVLLDLNLEDVNGLTVLQHIQNDPELAIIPVIVTSTAEESELSLKAIELGATDFVSKPFDPRLVRQRVKNAIHKRETEELRSQNRYLLMQKSDELRHQNELRYLAEHDALTNVCNKAAFYRKTRLMIDRAPDTEFLMIAFDIEKFRLINDIFGHEEGDRLLRFIAQRLQTQFSDKGTYSRVDADNFALCVPYDVKTLERQMAESDREMREYDLPFEILLVYGLYIIDDRTLPVSIMHDRAEMAKRTVKGNYVNRYAYYDDNLRKTMLDELDIVNDMNGALEKNQFEIYLQPKCILRTGEIIGAEALVRWNHPTRGVLLPGAFVPIFEKNGFIMRLDTYVWEHVCKLIRGWMDRYGGKPPIPLSMNVSRVDIYNPALVKTLCQLADRYGVPRRYMELEITESAYAEDPKLLSELIASLRYEGFTVEMDDFGSAYSSLNMLKEISVDVLKLDMRFLYGSDQDGRGGTILSSVVRMARYLSLSIVAEGVETAEQARFLISIGCSMGQGFLFYKPMPVGDFERLLASHPVKRFNDADAIYPESAVRRVWSIDGDFSLMLSTIPCAASLCEMSGDNIELLRINQEYLKITQDREEHIYRCGTDVRTLTTAEGYRQLLALFAKAFESQGFAEGIYQRFNEDGTLRHYKLKIKYLTGDAVRSLFFITYWPLDDCDIPNPAEGADEGDAQPRTAAAAPPPESCPEPPPDQN